MHACMRVHRAHAAHLLYPCSMEPRSLAAPLTLLASCIVCLLLQVRCYVGDNEQRWYMWYSGRGASSHAVDLAAASSGSIGAHVAADMHTCLHAHMHARLHACGAKHSANQARCVGPKREVARRPHHGLVKGEYVCVLQQVLDCYGQSAQGLQLLLPGCRWR